MSTPLVYINILTWNGQRWIEKCLDSVFATDYPNYKVVVVDNNSKDNTINIIEKGYPNVILIRNKKNLGFAEGHNIGIRYVLRQKAEYIVLLNQDVIVDSLWLNELVKVAKNHKEFAILTPFQYEYESNNTETHFLSTMLEYSKDFRDDYERGIELKNVYEYTGSFGAAIFVEKEVFLKVGLLDPFYFVYCEEADFFRRCLYLGYRMASVTSSKIKHWHMHLRPTEMSLRTKFFSYRNSFIFKLKDPQNSFLRNIKISFSYAIKMVSKNINSFKGLIKVFMIIYIQFLLIIILPYIYYKRYWEKRKACYL